MAGFFKALCAYPQQTHTSSLSRTNGYRQGRSVKPDTTKHKLESWVLGGFVFNAVTVVLLAFLWKAN